MCWSTKIEWNFENFNVVRTRSNVIESQYCFVIYPCYYNKRSLNISIDNFVSYSENNKINLVKIGRPINFTIFTLILFVFPPFSKTLMRESTTYFSKATNIEYIFHRISGRMRLLFEWFYPKKLYTETNKNTQKFLLRSE